MSILVSKAEQLAQQAEQLPEFHGFSLIGVKKDVTTLLSMIGKVREIFASYTVHDITHIEAVLHSLDWIIPPETQEQMTSVDWLMIVLAVYFHDLGMVVTAAEYENRNQNPKFTQFLDVFNNEDSAADYRERVQELGDEALQRFLYQEFIRTEHAARVREWIVGRTSYTWGQDVDAIAKTIVDALDKLPKRFRQHLGEVCESHHMDDLDDLMKYPLCQRFGSNAEEVANIQYAAIILRTADLLHVTRDRTPSISFKILGLTDPLGVDEWKKQQGVISVGMRAREYDPDDKETHDIQINADFDEERPFFTLTEYITYADQQIRQSKNWADTSSQTKDGKGYIFPWRAVKGKILVEGNEPVPMSFQLDRGRLLDLLVGHTIYNDATVAVRELIQNAIDAVRYQFHLDSREQSTRVTPAIGEVNVSWDAEDRYLVVTDNGIGMSMTTIVEHLMKVGSSYYDTPQFKAHNQDFSPISRFGIGVLAYFMISDDIEIVTFQEDVGYRIRMSSVHADYLVKKLEPGNPQLKGLEPHGTRVRLRIRPSVDLSKHDVGEIVDYWVILPECPVKFQGDGGEERSVGFLSVTDVLKKWAPEANANAKRHYLSKRKVDGYAAYEFGVICDEIYTPVRRFVGGTSNYAVHRTVFEQPPAVCVEGIRVSNTLPGLSSIDDGGFHAFLAIKGNKRLKTTVSRSQLEDDEEFQIISKLCLEFLVEHVRDEVSRISSFTGNPFSQASSAAFWLYDQLKRSIRKYSSYEILRGMYDKVPHYILESGTEAGEFSRELISKDELIEKGGFWTYKARYADNLGMMSRDLGREIAINEFLSLIAPDLVDKNVTPILIDYDQHISELVGTFRIETVQFQRSEKKVISYWRFDGGEWPQTSKFLEEFKISRDEFLGVAMSYDFSEALLSDRAIMESLTRVEGSINRIYTAKFDGDVEETHWIKDRQLTVLSDESNEAKQLVLLHELGAKLSSGGDAKGKTLIYFAYYLFLLMMGNGSPGDTTRYLGGNEQNHMIREARRVWNTVADELSEFDGASSDVWRKGEELFADEAKWFNSSSYWFSWGLD